MDGLITIIIFFIISSLFSGKKNQKKTSKRNVYNPVNKEKKDVSGNVQNSSSKNLLTEIRSAREKMLAETENINKSQPFRSFEKKVQNIKKDSSVKNSDMKDMSNKSLIPADYISQEGISDNPDYIYEGDLEISDEIIPITIKSQKKLFENKSDLKRAIILKEVLDKPLSLRTGR